MTLTLRIENYDSLPDGGPTSATVTGTGMTAGRGAAMDWTLPDPQKHISGHHFDISYRDGAYWLTDVSTNGVFLDGQRHRIEGAYQLKQGDRFQVGNYFIVVDLGGGAAPVTPPQAMTPAPEFDDSDPWAVSSTPSAPVDVTPRPDPRAFEDFASDFIVNPVAPRPAPAPQPSAPVPAAVCPPVSVAPMPWSLSAACDLYRAAETARPSAGLPLHH